MTNLFALPRSVAEEWTTLSLHCMRCLSVSTHQVTHSCTHEATDSWGKGRTPHMPHASGWESGVLACSCEFVYAPQRNMERETPICPKNWAYVGQYAPDGFVS